MVPSTGRPRSRRAPDERPPPDPRTKLRLLSVLAVVVGLAVLRERVRERRPPR